MSTVAINIKTPKEIKEKAKKIALDLGLPLGTIINAYLREFIRNKEIHFSVIPQMTPHLENVIGKTEMDLKNGKNISPVFSSSKEMDDYLDS